MNDPTGPATRTLTSPDGLSLAYEVEGSGPALILVHGSFSDHRSNWALVMPALAARFTVHALARRGRGDTDATRNHSLVDEAHDVGALMQVLDGKVFLVGHSYGAQVALAAAGLYPDKVRKLVLYEPPRPDTLQPAIVRELEDIARAADWDLLATTFFRDVLMVPEKELEDLQGSEIWPPIVGDARASLEDLKALIRYDFSPNRFGSLNIPVLLQVGTESPRDMFATDSLARALPDVRIEELHGQGHEGMNTAPDDYARAVIGFLSA